MEKDSGVKHAQARARQGWVTPWEEGICCEKFSGV